MGVVLLSSVLLSIFNVAAFANPGSQAVSVSIREVIPTAEEIYLDKLQASAGGRPGGRPDRDEEDDEDDRRFRRSLPTRDPGERPRRLSIDELNDLVVIGEKVIRLIDSGRATATIQRQAVAVVPQAMTTWTALAGWAATPAFKVFMVDIRGNMCRMLAGARIKISANYGGSYQGTGSFLSGVTMIPTAVMNNSYGSGFDLWTEFRDPVNIGSFQNPVAAVGMDIRFRYHNLTMDFAGAYDATINGRGQIVVDTTATGISAHNCRAR